MTKYIKILSILVIASIIACPASAKIIHLNKLTDHLFPGSGSLGFAGCPAGTYLSEPDGAVCEVSDENGCLSDCECRVEYGFNYSSEECKGPAFKQSGSVCDLSKSDEGKYSQFCSCADGYLSDGELKCENCVYEGFEDVFNFHSEYVAKDSEGASVYCYNPAEFTCGGSNNLMDLTDATIKYIGDGTNVEVTYTDDPFVYEGRANYTKENKNNPNLKICVTSISVKDEFKEVIKNNLSTPTCADGTVPVNPKYGAYNGGNQNYNFSTAKPECTTSCTSTANADGPCVQKSDVYINYYDTSTNTQKQKKCSKPIGCFKGIVNGHLCIENTHGQAEAATVKGSTEYDDDQHCVEISGCKVDEGWEIYGTIAKDSASNIQTKFEEAKNPSDDPTMYTAVKHEGIGDITDPNSIGYIICRMATGCKINYNNKPVCDYSNMATEWADFLRGVENF